MKTIYSSVLSLLLTLSAYAEAEKMDTKQDKTQRNPAEANSVVLVQDGTKYNIPACGKNAEAHFFKRSSTKAVIRITGVTDCSNYETSKENGKLEGNANGPRNIDIEFPLIPGRTTVQKVNIYSNSGKTSAEITAKIVSAEAKSPPTNVLIYGQKPSSLQNCGGTASLSSSQNGSGEAQYNIKIKNMKSCNRFDILESNGSTVMYSAKEITGQDPSFTLPKKVVSRGLSFNDPLLDLFFGTTEPNLIKIRFYNAYQPGHQDIMYLYFHNSGELTSTSSDEVNL